MYTQVAFAEFLGRLLDKVKEQRGIKFDESPNVPIHWQRGDWLYEIKSDFSIRLFRWLDHDKEEEIVAGPNWSNGEETREEFERRFENDFWKALDSLA